MYRCGYAGRIRRKTLCPLKRRVPDANHQETEKQLITKALNLFPDDKVLARKATADDYPSRFRQVTDHSNHSL